MLQPMFHLTSLVTNPVQREIYVSINGGDEVQYQIDLVATPGDDWT